MASPLIASAFVEIKPDPASIKRFPTAVKNELRNALKQTKITVPVTPQLTAYKQRFRSELRSAKLTVAVQPVLTEGAKRKFQAQLRAQALATPVQILAPAGGAAVGGGAVGGLSAAQGQLAQTGLSAAEGQVALNAALAQGAILIPEMTTATVALNTVRTEGVASTAASAAADKIAQDRALALADSKAAVAGVTDALTTAEKRSALTTTELAAKRALYQGQLRASTLAEDAYALAVESENAAQIRLTTTLRGRIATDLKAAEAAVAKQIADNKAAAAANRRAGAEALAARGFGATALAAIGARGATLAASKEFLVGAAAATALFKSVQLFASLQEELNVFQATVHATGVEMVAVSAKAKQLGQDITLPAVSANDAAEAMTELAKAGLSVQDSMDAARGTLQLATAAQLDNQTAVNITASALNAFGLAGDQAVHVADLLAGASNEAQGGIASMGEALGSVASVARQAGVSVEDTVALLTLLAKNGIQGAESGTALRVAILRLIAPTDKAREVLKDLNIRVLDLQGNLRPTVFSEIDAAVQRLGPNMRNMALQTIYGTRAIRAQAVLGREGITGLNAMRDATDQQGLAAELAGARTRGFSGDVEALKNSLATFGLEIGEVAVPALTELIDAGIGVVEVFQRIADEVDKTKRQIEGVGERTGFDLGSIVPKSVTDVLFADWGDLLEKTEASDEVFSRWRQLGLGDVFADPLDVLERMNQEIIDSTDNTGVLADKLNELQGKGGLSAAIVYVKELRSQLYGSGEEVQKTREYLDGVIRVLVGLGRAPTMIELEAFIKKGFIPDALAEIQNELNRQAPIELKAGFSATSIVDLQGVARAEAKKGAEAWLDEWEKSLPQAVQMGLEWMQNFGAGAKEAAAGAALEAAGAFRQSMSTQLALAELTPSTGDDLKVWQAILTRRQQTLERAQAAFANAKTPKQKTAADKWVQAAAKAVKEAEDAIAAIIQGQAADSKARTDKIASARNEADQNFLDALGLARGGKENAVLRAEGTARLTDDIRTHTALRNFLIKSREEARKTLKDAQTRAEAVQSLTADIIKENQTLQQLQRDLQDSLQERFDLRLDVLEQAGTLGQIRRLFQQRIKELTKAYKDAQKGTKLAMQLRSEILRTQDELRDIVTQAFELDIEFAQTTENRRAEIAARERLIKYLQGEQKKVKRGTLEYKRLRNAIAEQQKAINELRGALNERNNKFGQLQFEFLQAQQGFVANLLGNLIPGGATGGLVGGSSAATAMQTLTSATSAGLADMSFGLKASPGGAINPEAFPGARRGGVAAALSSQAQIKAGVLGPSRVQAATQVELLRKILAVLNAMHRGTATPEARYNREKSGASMDMGHGGGGSMATA